MPRPNWRAAAITAACVLPVSGLCAWTTDRACNHLPAETSRAQPGTPRGAWCSVVGAQGHWPLLILTPALIAGLLVLLCGRHRWLYSVAWLIACGLALAQALHVESLRPELLL